MPRQSTPLHRGIQRIAPGLAADHHEPLRPHFAVIITPLFHNKRRIRGQRSPGSRTSTWRFPDAAWIRTPEGPADHHATNSTQARPQIRGGDTHGASADNDHVGGVWNLGHRATADGVWCMASRFFAAERSPWLTDARPPTVAALHRVACVGDRPRCRPPPRAPGPHADAARTEARPHRGRPPRSTGPARARGAARPP